MNTAVSVIIPTYNAQHLLEAHLPLLVAALDDQDEVMVVDDASSDDTVIWMINYYRLVKVPEIPELTLPAKYFPRINDDTTELYTGEVQYKGKIILLSLAVNSTNLRFAGTSNKGAALAKYSWLFLLNNDVIVDRSALSDLKIIIREQPDVFAVGCIEYEDKKQSVVSGKNKLWFERGLYIHSKADDFDFGETAWASGGSALFSKEKWLQLRGFDLKFYPAYWEDIDLSYRAKQRGWKVLFSPNAVVYHKHETTNANVIGLKKIEQLSWKHAQYFTWKHSTFSQKLQFIFWSPYWTIKRYLKTISL